MSMTNHSTIISGLAAAMRNASSEYEGDLLCLARNIVMAAESQDDLARLILHNAANELAMISQGLDCEADKARESFTTLVSPYSHPL